MEHGVKLRLLHVFPCNGRKSDWHILFLGVVTDDDDDSSSLSLQSKNFNFSLGINLSLHFS